MLTIIRRTVAVLRAGIARDLPVLAVAAFAAALAAADAAPGSSAARGSEAEERLTARERLAPMPGM